MRIKDQIAMLTVVPDLVHFDPISEIIFLVDRSGSMGGEKMRKTKDTMQIFLRSLPMGTSFNISTPSFSSLLFSPSPPSSLHFFILLFWIDSWIWNDVQAPVQAEQRVQ